MSLLILGLVFLNVIRKDFLVNDDTTGGAFQSASSIAINKNGSFVVVWNDFRSTDYDGDIYYQRYDTIGNPLGSNFKVNEEKGGPCWNPYWFQVMPSVAMSKEGNFVVVWEDWRNGEPDIYGEMYDSSGTPLGVNFRVNNDPASGHQYCPSVSKSSGFIVVWDDYRNSNLDIYAQLYDSSGVEQGANFKVNDDNGSNHQGNSLVQMSNSGNFVVVWEDWRDNNLDIYAQMYDSKGNLQGQNFRVNTNTNLSSQSNPSVSIDSVGNFIIVWKDMRTGIPCIYAQRFSNEGIPLDDNFLICEGNEPWISMSTQGNFVVVWEKAQYVYGKIYDFSGIPQTEEFKISDVVQSNQVSSPMVAMSKNFVVVWMDYRHDNPDIYGQRFSLSGIPEAHNFKINEDEGSSHQDFPSVGMDSSGNFVVIWYDYRNGFLNQYNDPDIYGQKYNKLGETCGDNFRINDDGSSHTQRFPVLSMNRGGKFIVVWDDKREGSSQIYGQRYNEYTEPQGKNFKINDTQGGNIWPAVSINDSGNIVVAWYNLKNSYLCTYVQRYNSSGVPIGNNFKIQGDVESEKHLPSVALFNSGNFIIAWIDERDANKGLYAQMYNKDGNPISENFRVLDITGTVKCGYSSIGIGPSGSFIILWMDYRNENWDIYGQQFDSSATPISQNFKVNDDIGSCEQNNPSVAIDKSGKFIVVFSDTRDAQGDINILAQQYNADGTPYGPNIQIHENSGISNHQWAWKSIATNSDLIAFTWVDNRRLKGWDVYAKLTDWVNFFIDENFIPTLPHQFISIYPNPCRGSFNISLSEPMYGELYDVSGKLYKKVGRLAKGKHFITNEGILGGIYFLKIKGKGTSISQKIVVLR